MKEYKEKTFSIECMDNFKGYTDGTTWNGWECPKFTYEVGMEIVGNFTSFTYQGLYNKEMQSFEFRNTESDEELEIFDKEEIMVNGKLLEVYTIGDGWVWEEAAKW